MKLSKLLLRLLPPLLARRMPKKMLERRARKEKVKAKVLIVVVLLMMLKLSKLVLLTLFNALTSSIKTSMTFGPLMMKPITSTKNLTALWLLLKCNQLSKRATKNRLIR